jgi:sialate O-acetylesterase
MTLPSAWESAGLPAFDGVVWFRKEINIPDNWAGKDLALSLGPIDDRDTTYWNGSPIGNTDAWNRARNYVVPGSLVRAGRNVIAIRVLDTGGGGGLGGRPEQMRVAFSTKERQSLAGEWLYRVGVELTKAPPVPAAFENNPNLPTVLYNGMIAPLVPYGLKGTIWYQGESNVGRAKQYQTLLPALIADWRQEWGQGDFPFYIVQIANYLEASREPSNDAWAELREAQNIAADKAGNSGVAVTIDIGDTGDIHPKNKQDVGKRLALLALAHDYSQPVEYSGPVYKSSKREGNTIRILFEHADGLRPKDGKVTGFAIAGDDGKFVWADAHIEGPTVVVSSPQVPEPTAVRYAWDRNPAASLYNRAGLPASPFRTDME